MPTKYAGVAELADALDLGSSALRRGGSTPFTRTIRVSSFWFQGFGAFFVSGIIFLKKVLRCISHFNTLLCGIIIFSKLFEHSQWLKRYYILFIYTIKQAKFTLVIFDSLY